MTYLNKHSKYPICSYILWLMIPKLLTVSVECYNTKNPDVCLTPGCEAAANLIKQHIDTKIEPCDDFYNFACGNLKKNIKIKNQRQWNIGQTSLLSQTILNNLTQALIENIDPNEPRIFKLVKNYYTACLNHGTIDNTEISGLRSLFNLMDDLGGWPMILGDAWDESKFDWMESLSKLRKYGSWFDYLLQINIARHENNSNHFLLDLTRGSVFGDRNILQDGWDNRQYVSYIKYIVDIALYFNTPNSLKQVLLDAFDVVEFERDLVYNDQETIPIIVPIENIPKYDSSYFMPDNKTPIPTIPWLELINNLTFPVAKFKATDEVQLHSPNYLMYLPYQLERVGKRTVANYLIWRVIADLAPTLNEYIRTLNNDYKVIDQSRNEHCLELLYSGYQGLPIGTDALYVSKYKSEDTTRDVNNLIQSMRSELDSYIKKLTWLDDETRHEALQKAQDLNFIIGFPNELYNGIRMDNSSSNLDINRNDHFSNILNTRSFNFEQYFSTFHGSVNNLSNVIHKTYTEPNAYYNRNSNSIQLNVAFLQSPVYRFDWPNYMKYGALGTVIGHEMMHAFDNQSLFFDATQNDNQWYTNQTALKYQNKMKCFVQQYSKYHVKKVQLKVDGSRTLNENLADYGGTKLGYSGYKKWVQDNGEEARLPGLDNYTPEQIFWIMSANLECSKSTDEYKRYSILNDAHTLSKFRVHGIVKNSVDFANDFKCPVGSRMNPKKKCSLAK